MNREAAERIYDSLAALEEKLWYEGKLSAKDAEQIRRTYSELQDSFSRITAEKNFGEWSEEKESQLKQKGFSPEKIAEIKRKRLEEMQFKEHFASRLKEAGLGMDTSEKSRLLEAELEESREKLKNLEDRLERERKAPLVKKVFGRQAEALKERLEDRKRGKEFLKQLKKRLKEKPEEFEKPTEQFSLGKKSFLYDPRRDAYFRLARDESVEGETPKIFEKERIGKSHRLWEKLEFARIHTWEKTKAGWKPRTEPKITTEFKPENAKPRESWWARARKLFRR